VEHLELFVVVSGSNLHRGTDCPE